VGRFWARPEIFLLGEGWFRWFNRCVKILVTGAAGFIGFHVARRLLELGHEVAGLDNFNAYYNPALKEARFKELSSHKKLTFHRVDLADRRAMEDVFAAEKFGRVIHLGAQAGVRYSLENPHAYIQGNLVGFANVLEGCRKQKVDHLVYASSSSVYGLNTTMPFKVGDNVDHPVSLYAATKKANELMAHTYGHLYGIPTTGLRFFTVYGPWGRPDMAVFLFTKAILNGEKIDLYNKGKMRRDFTYIDDIVEGVVRTADVPAKTDPKWKGSDPHPGSSSAPWRLYNIGNQHPVELIEFVQTLEEVLGKKAKINYLPLQPGDMVATAADVGELQSAIGYAPRTALKDGLEKFATWYREHAALCAAC
jgi:UDP-glucuronate 4-epimerase